MILLLCTLVALAAHILLGWQWSIVGGIAAGVAVRRLGPVVGMAAVGVSWLTLVLYNFATAPAETARFVQIAGELFGNMPTSMFVVMTILLGAVLGLLGGAIGSMLRRLSETLVTRRSNNDVEGSTGDA